MNYEEEISFGAFDSELMHQEIFIPEGFEATIEGSKIILKKIESKDEKIRKRLIDFFEDWHENRSHCWGIAVTDILAWLEKQGQKPEDKIKPKFKVGDWVVVSTTKGDKVVQIASVEYLKDGYPSYTTTEGRWFGNGTKARLLTDKDTETITLPESKFITYKDKEKQGEQNPTDKPKFKVKYAGNEYNVFDIKASMGIIWYGIEDEPNHIDYIKADSCEIISGISGYSKPTDNDMVEALRTEYEKGRADAFTQMQELTWKPSDEQMEALNDVISSRDIKYDVLSELWKDLKKLKEE